MTTSDLLRELRSNNVKETACLIQPAYPVEGALCLTKTDEGPWRVFLNERGDYLINETFQSEHDASRFFLKRALSEPTYQKGFTPELLHTWPSRKKQILAKYGFEDDGL